MPKTLRFGLLLVTVFVAVLLVILYRNSQNGRYRMRGKAGGVIVVLDTWSGELRYEECPSCVDSSGSSEDAEDEPAPSPAYEPPPPPMEDPFFPSYGEPPPPPPPPY